ncbi:aminotransferase class IV [Plebeiibacterium marinum]|uniref:branched-chain-amino-acid transaminase n=1 Tax=Plebeiibacterium marinum TaxID=2992111 RepID=A0AAE3MBV2_9BACT|nr:aminotransferase class IV [Plebeiobacterium marinum]MCW3805023.1 aminotransferase class IV [Plebeiobacterium marinum]
MHDLVNYNGKIYPSNQVPVSYKNRAFKFGDSLFETIRANGHYPLSFNLHYKRLRKAMLSLKMNLASIPAEEELNDQIVKLLQKQKSYGASRVRLEIFRSGEGLYTPATNSADFIIETSQLQSPKYSLNSKGLLISVYPEMKKSYNPISFFKSGNSLHYILAALHKKEEALDDCLLINEKNKIIEATSSNIFWIKNGIVYTPSVFSGCVDGVMRQTIIALIQKTKDLQIEECNGATEEELLDADEIFLTNAIQGIQWVVGYKDRRFFNYNTKLLLDALNKYTFD